MALQRFWQKLCCVKYIVHCTTLQNALHYSELLWLVFDYIAHMCTALHCTTQNSTALHWAALYTVEYTVLGLMWSRRTGGLIPGVNFSSHSVTVSYVLCFQDSGDREGFYIRGAELSNLDRPYRVNQTSNMDKLTNGFCRTQRTRFFQLCWSVISGY